MSASFAMGAFEGPSFVSAAASHDKHEEILPKEKMTFNEVYQLALRVSRMDHYIKKHPLNIEPSQKIMEEWLQEIVPQFESLGMTNDASMPTDFQFQQFTDPFYYGHVLGTSNCGGEMRINARMDNPLSTWYESDNFWGTITHETAHQQQGSLCHTSDRAMVESSAQVAMMQVTSALAISGNRIAMHSWINEMNDMTEGALWYMAILEPKAYGQLWEQYKRTVDVTPEDRAIRARTEEKWKGKEMQLLEILLDYSYLPLASLYGATQNGDVTNAEIMPNPHYSVWEFWYIKQHLEELTGEIIK